MKKENPSHIGVAFDPAGPTFRHEAYAQYKAQREETPETIRLSVPVIKDIIRAYRIPILEVSGYEADDVIGTLATQAGRRGIPTYMMTPDKDYGQLVGGTVFMFRPKHTGGFETMGPEEVKAKFNIADTSQVIDMLGLMGDTADNIPGCPGVGEKTAQKLIAQFGSIENLLAHTEELKGALRGKVEANKEQIVFSKFLATIKTDVPIELDMDALVREEPDPEALRKIFNELEFRSLLNRILGKPAPTSTPGQGDLFASIEPEETEPANPSELESLETQTVDYRLVETETDILALVEQLMPAGILSIDTETTSTEPMEAELVGASFSDAEGRAWYVPFPADRKEAEHRASLLRPLYENPGSLKVGQNIKYDIIVLQNYGVRVAGPLFDTMLAHYVLQPELRHNMDYLAEVYLNYRTIHIEQLIGPRGKGQKSMRDLPPADLYRYACEDADITLRLKNVLEKELETHNAFNLFNNIEMPLVPVLVNLESNGVRIDTKALRATSSLLAGRLHEIEQDVYRLAGEVFNISSPRQVGEVLFEHLKIAEKAKKTKTGQYVTSEEVLESLRGKHDVVGKILDYRGLKKLLSTYVDALPQLINPRTGRIHTSFNQAVTATGRLSSSNPNLQNIPVRDDDGKEMRKAFIPDDGCEFFSADYSQIELRIMAHLSGDENMIDAFRSGHDIHAATAAKIFKVDIHDVTQDMRRKAKTANFGIIYGARTQGYVETIFHRKRFLPDINSRNATVRGYAERNAINAPIQGSAADIIKVAMARIYRRFTAEGLKAKMILQVHDELNFSVPVDEKERVQEIVIHEMENACPMQVPLKADCGWGRNWLEAH